MTGYKELLNAANVNFKQNPDNSIYILGQVMKLLNNVANTFHSCAPAVGLINERISKAVKCCEIYIEYKKGKATLKNLGEPLMKIPRDEHEIVSLFTGYLGNNHDDEGTIWHDIYYKILMKEPRAAPLLMN